jgi:arsenate reductase
MVLYGLKNCDTCRKALKVLTEVDFVDVRGQGVPADVMAKALDQFGTKLLNTRSTTWRELGEGDRSRPASELLAKYPVLMKRPLIENAGQLWLGWTAETRTGLGVD